MGKSTSNDIIISCVVHVLCLNSVCACPGDDQHHLSLQFTVFGGWGDDECDDANDDDTVPGDNFEVWNIDS